MDTALCTIDNSSWTASEFFALSGQEIETRKRNLVCHTCNGDAWFRRSNYGKHSPHFCAHHADGCVEATAYQVIGEGDGGDEQPAANPDSGIIIDLGLGKPTPIAIEKKEFDVTAPTGQHKTPTIINNGGGIDYPAHATLKNILYKLVRSDKLYQSDAKVVLNDERFAELPNQANKLFINFADISEDLNKKKRIYWGFISDAGYTSKDGRLWLNAGRRKDGLSIAVNSELVDEFKKQFKITDTLDELSGCHALIIGDPYYTPSTGKPVIWCASLELIVLRRYNFDISD
ncbi:hypothetical protein GBN33_03165 [Plesiomonas shigelloides]|uniref:hypothetical protein n=1 Tax=Plesiomonas shigelloides TaxID=703 RepID=UPI001262553E|nr:hypothetical protein [Plesiomonas shigelloides]KAB7702088.1 hypothetical protein GBN33_03165 [Plesiomonas shigelloides]